MKNLLYTLTAVLVLFFLANCVPQPKVSENINREWMLVEFREFQKEFLVKNKARLDLTQQKQAGRFAANMGCNSMFGHVKFGSGGNIKFADVGSTMMYCEKNMDLESAFGKALPAMTRYEIQGHYLTLSDDKGNKMKFVAADWD